MTMLRQFSAATLFATLCAMSAAAVGAPVLSDGEIRKVDKEAAKLTIRHGAIKNLGMAPMTMVFKVQDNAMLDKVKAGDKVQFAVEKLGGMLTVTAIDTVQQ